MSEDLRVDPVEVWIAADHVDVAAHGLRSAHGSAHERMGAAQASWIGSSAAALAAATAKWEEQSAGHFRAAPMGNPFRTGNSAPKKPRAWRRTPR